MCDAKAERASLEAYQNIVPPMPLHALYTPNCLLLSFVPTSFQPKRHVRLLIYFSCCAVVCHLLGCAVIVVVAVVLYQDPTLGFYSNADVFVSLPFCVNGMEGMRQPSPFIIIMTQ